MIRQQSTLGETLLHAAVSGQDALLRPEDIRDLGRDVRIHLPKCVDMEPVTRETPATTSVCDETELTFKIYWTSGRYQHPIARLVSGHDKFVRHWVTAFVSPSAQNLSWWKRLGYAASDGWCMVAGSLDAPPNELQALIEHLFGPETVVRSIEVGAHNGLEPDHLFR
jgi:hypothetical protein